MVARDVITTTGSQFVHLWAMVTGGDGDTAWSEDYQWLFHITEDIAPVSETDDTPCPSLDEARFAKNGGCLVKNVPWVGPSRYRYKCSGQEQSGHCAEATP